MNRGVDFAAIAVPIFYFVPRLLARGTPYTGYVEAGWEVLAAALLVLVVLKLAYNWEERAQTHSKLLGQNILLIGQTNDLLLFREKVPEDNVPLFLRLAEQSEMADREAIGQVAEKDRQFAYREGLKELGDVSICCPFCKASPWAFKPGSCQLCGNTPAVEVLKTQQIVS